MAPMDTLWIVLAALMVLKMQAGFLFLETGMTRAKNGASVAIKNIADFVVVVLAFWAVGFGTMFGSSLGGFAGTDWHFFSPSADMTVGGISGAAVFFFQLAFATTAATIVSGAVAERTRFVAYVWLSLWIGALIYPVVGHWAWGGLARDGQAGWLESLGFVDLAGSTVVHSVGGWAALVLAIVVGPRLGRFSRRGRVFEPASLPLATFGTILLWVGWTGFNSGSLLRFDSLVPLVIVATILAAAAGGSCAILLSYFLRGHAQVGFVLNGILAGLVAVTAGAHALSPVTAVAVGAGGAVAMALASALMVRLRIDDAVDAVAVHLAGGIWGTIAVALFADPAAFGGRGRIEQLGIQLLGITATGVWVVLATGLCLSVLAFFGGVRARPREELLGLSLAEHGARGALQILLDQMRRHRTSGSFRPRAPVDRATEVGVLADSYNKVLDRVETEIAERNRLAERERQARHMAEGAYEAMREALDENSRAARRDALTGLGNRLLLEEIMSESRLSDALGTGETIICLCVDMDRFKEVNDTYGHAAGDAVLTATAARIAGMIDGDRDLGFRIGGDEFVILRQMARDESAERYASALLAEICAPVDYGAARLSIGASIGFALVDRSGPPLREAMRRADMALYRAKDQGRNRAVAYAPEIGARFDTHMRLLKDFRRAMETDQIFVEFQPQVSATTREITGCETLARWLHPDRGRIAPDVFIPLAEEIGMLDALDRRVLDHALEALAGWDAAGLHVPRISVNVSAKRLFSGDLLAELAARRDLPGHRLAFEVLESAFIDRVDEQLRWTIDGLQDLGIEIEIDDFGTGHASFASVFALRPDRLKLDRIFAQRLETDPTRRMLTGSLIEMAHRLETRVIVEGVETLGQAEILRDLGAEDLQGYAFGRPMSAEAFMETFRKRVA